MGEVDDRIDPLLTQKSPEGDAPAPTTAKQSLSIAPTLSVASEPANASARLLTYPRGTLLGRYVLLDELGRGGMGVVYRAYDPELDRSVALKIMPTRKPRADGRAAETDRVFREAQALARLSHPNVVAVHDVGEVDDVVFVAMELVVGATLRAWLAARPAHPLRETLGVLLAAGEGLAAAHAAGIVHRDFKPDNVIVGEDGRVRVLDFGLARATADTTPDAGGDLTTTGAGKSQAPRAPTSGERPTSSGPSLARSMPPSSRRAPRALEAKITRQGAVMGTPAYMAPELFRGGVADTRSDQYSFCASLYEALFGDRPPPAKRRLAEGPSARAPLPLPPRPKVPAPVRRALQRGLAFEPDARFPSMRALLDELGREPLLPARRWVPLAVAGLALATGIVLARRGAPTPCRGGDARLTGVWDATQRGRLEASFAATRVPFAKDSARTVGKALDAYAATWVDTEREACEATRVRGTQSEALLDLRMACLDRRLGELRSQVTVLANADAKVVEKAVTAVGTLPAVATCADLESLRSAVPMPTDPSTRAQVEDTTRLVDDARAQHRAGHLREADPLARAALARARTIPFRPLEAEALYVLASVERDAGSYDEAVRLFTDAARTAFASRRDDLVARSWTALLVVRGDSQSRFDEAHRATLDAEAAIERLHGDETLLAELVAAQAKVAFREGKYEDASRLGERALALRERVLGPEHPSVGDVLADLGNAHAIRNDLGEAEALYARAEALLVKSFGEDHPKVTSVRNNMGNVALMRGRADLALAHFTRARDAWIRVVGTVHPDVGTTHLNVGGALQQLGRNEEAQKELEKARAVYVVTVGEGHPDVALVDLNVGTTLASRELHDAAIPYFKKALDVLERYDHPHRAYALQALGASYLAQKRYELAAQYFAKALAIREKALGKDHPEVGESLRSLAEAHLERGATSDALPLLARAYALFTTLGSEADPVQRGRTAFAFARATWATGGAARARALAEEARTAFQQAGPPAANAAAQTAAWLASHATP